MDCCTARRAARHTFGLMHLFVLKRWGRVVSIGVAMHVAALHCGAIYILSAVAVRPTAMLFFKRHDKFKTTACNLGTLLNQVQPGGMAKHPHHCLLRRPQTALALLMPRAEMHRAGRCTPRLGDARCIGMPPLAPPLLEPAWSRHTDAGRPVVVGGREISSRFGISSRCGGGAAHEPPRPGGRSAAGRLAGGPPSSLHGVYPSRHTALTERYNQACRWQAGRAQAGQHGGLRLSCSAPAKRRVLQGTLPLPRRHHSGHLGADACEEVRQVEVLVAVRDGGGLLHRVQLPGAGLAVQRRRAHLYCAAGTSTLRTSDRVHDASWHMALSRAGYDWGIWCPWFDYVIGKELHQHGSTHYHIQQAQQANQLVNASALLITVAPRIDCREPQLGSHLLLGW